MDNAVLMEIESLRRASTGGSAREVPGGVSGRNAIAGTGNICSGGLPGGCRHWPKEISPNALADGRSEIAQDADLRMIAPRDFFTVERRARPDDARGPESPGTG